MYFLASVKTWLLVKGWGLIFTQQMLAGSDDANDLTYQVVYTGLSVSR
jgi:hypothetical protein